MLKFWLSPIGVMIVGVLTVISGSVQYWKAAQERVPERSELVQIAGEVLQAKVVWKQSLKGGKTSDVHYELVVRREDATTPSLQLPEFFSNNDVADLNGKQVTALVRSDKNNQVWELRSEGRELSNYQRTFQSINGDLETRKRNNAMIIGAGVIVLLAAAAWHIRRREPRRV